MNTITQITTRRQAIIKYAEKKGVTAAARRYNVGRTSIYRWMKRYDGTLESLKDRSHRPHSHPNQHTEEEIKLIKDMRKRNTHTGLVVFWVKLRQKGYTRSIPSLWRMLRKLELQPIKPPNPIKEYSYKPEPIFYGDNSRYFGVELEIDVAGKDCDYADELLEIANEDKEHIYIKSDGSLNDGMEIVTHPMTLDYHKNYCWEDIMRKAVSLGYRSHQTSTCGLHIHVNKTSLGETNEEQEDVISRILYFVEHHWNELLKFSRRSEATMNRWAARYGYENTPKAIMDKAKKGSYGRYTAVNLCNYHTVEFRLFRGTLKFNTLIATLQLVNEICNVAVSLSDDQLQKLSWSSFVETIKDDELIQYLKERNLYINEKIESQEEM